MISLLLPTLLAFSSVSVSAAPGENMTTPDPIRVRTALFAVSALDYHILVGTWDDSPAAHYVTYTPTGNGPHILDLQLTGSEFPTIITVDQGGVVIVTTHALLVSSAHMDLIELVSTLGAGGGTCSGTYSNVSSWVATETDSDCWKPLVHDPETGVWSQKCQDEDPGGCRIALERSRSPAVPHRPRRTRFGSAQRRVTGKSPAMPPPDNRRHSSITPRVDARNRPARGQRA